jgi:hypothetical protein
VYKIDENVKEKHSAEILELGEEMKKFYAYIGTTLAKLLLITCLKKKIRSESKNYPLSVHLLHNSIFPLVPQRNARLSCE